MNNFNEGAFRSKVDKALESVKRIIDNTRTPYYPSELPHQYEDKYLLADSLTHNAVAAYVHALEPVGLTPKVRAQLKEWVHTRTVTLQFNASEDCVFVKETKRDVESDTKHVTKIGILGTVKDYTVTTVREWFWKFSSSWQLVAYPGVDEGQAVVLQSGGGSVELKTTVETSPKPSNVIRNPIRVDITWLLRNFQDSVTKKGEKDESSEVSSVFSIDRKNAKCATPRRNPDVNNALTFMSTFKGWAHNVYTYFVNTLFPTYTAHNLDLSPLYRSEVFVPVVPLFFESSGVGGSEEEQSVMPPSVYKMAFLEEQKRTLAAKFNEIAQVFTSMPAEEKQRIVTVSEGRLIAVVLHIENIASAYSEGVDYIESMLYKQLIAAIGREVTSQDFSNYLTFHNRKLFKSTYQPSLFSYPIRRANHDPEGTLSIETDNAGTASQPISTICSHIQHSPVPMAFNISASTKVEFYGDRFLHGYISHQFARSTPEPLSLIARARQFSSFILIVGRIVSATLFDPKSAIIIQNKDELKIPLMLETIPTPKEFKDAIESLSPSQQAFAKAFRSLQLESTLFGVCVIQIKPQLERLLNLPGDSLTKEIQLSQDLLSLFIKYQIPSDLVSYDGNADAGVAQKVQQVKGYVTAMQEMISKMRKDELAEAEQEKKYSRAQREEDVMVTLSAPAPRPTVMRMMRSSASSGGGAPGAPAPSLSAAPRSMMSAAPAAAYPPPMPSSAPPMPSSAPPPTPQAPQLQQQQQQQPQQQQEQPQQQLTPEQQKELQQQAEGEGGNVGALSVAGPDYTKIPQELEKKFEKFDRSNALRPTIITPGKVWNKKYFKSLLSQAEYSNLGKDELETVRSEAFDLLDALTKAGSLAIRDADLHVVIASTHCFDKSIIDTIIQDNVNPIEKVENSTLLVASTIHQVSTVEEMLIAPTPHHAQLLSSDNDNNNNNNSNKNKNKKLITSS